jgi:hypothetical protein
MKSIGLKVLTVGLAVVAAASARAEGEFSGQLRARFDERRSAGIGPLAEGARLAPSLVARPASSAVVDSELRGRWRAVAAAVLLREERPVGGAWQGDAVVNELNLSGDAAGWQFSAGRKVVAWDVGYGFRPNDVVQQEARRTLVSSTPQGRAVLQAERFDAHTAWSWVWVNPQRVVQGDDRFGADEQALALRVFRHAGSADWHGFARHGQHTHGSVGGAVSWVASDSLELHASGRVAGRADVLRSDATAGLVTSSPYQLRTGGKAAQALLGGTWTGESKLSLMAEWWYDSTAVSNGQWDDWAGRNRTLLQMAGPGAPEPLRQGVGGNLAWQAQAFGTPSLRRNNVFLRSSWDHEGWQPSLDVLFMPADRGRIWTAALGWQGDRLRVDVGLRWNDGPDTAVVMQLPTRRTAYAALAWSL